MPLNRLIAPARAASPISVFGRTYQQTPGNVVDVPSGDTGTLLTAGWRCVGLSGTSAQRPAQGQAVVGLDGLVPGLEYLDTTLGRCIFFDGLLWRDPATGSPV